MNLYTNQSNPFNSATDNPPCAGSDFEEPLKIKDKLSKLLKEARKSEGLTQLQLSKKAKVPRSAIARIEGNENRPVPTFKFFSKLMDAMGYTTNISVIKGKKKFHAEF